MTKAEFNYWAEDKIVEEFTTDILVADLPQEVPALVVGMHVFLLFEDGVGVFEKGSFYREERVNLTRWTEDAKAWSQFLMLRDALAGFIEIFDVLNLKRVRGW